MELSIYGLYIDFILLICSKRNITFCRRDLRLA